LRRPTAGDGRHARWPKPALCAHARAVSARPAQGRPKPAAVAPSGAISAAFPAAEIVDDNAGMSLHRGNLFLIGLMGAGKSTLGRQIARRAGMPFVDADIELERRLGVSIPTIFEIEGEQSFRDREEALIDELTQLTGIVLATGGGAVTRQGSRDALRERGTVVYLHAAPGVLYDRVKNARNRPMLKVEDPLARITSLYEVRDPLYRGIADHIVESERDRVLRFARTLMTDAIERDRMP
jgi:shikimate kinase